MFLGIGVLDTLLFFLPFTRYSLLKWIKCIQERGVESGVFSILQKRSPPFGAPFLHELTKLSGTIANDHINDDGVFAELFFEFGFSHFYEVGVQFFADQIDGATTESATHDA